MAMTNDLADARGALLPDKFQPLPDLGFDFVPQIPELARLVDPLLTALYAAVLLRIALSPRRIGANWRAPLSKCTCRSCCLRCRHRHAHHSALARHALHLRAQTEARAALPRAALPHGSPRRHALLVSRHGLLWSHHVLHHCRPLPPRRARPLGLSFLGLRHTARRRLLSHCRSHSLQSVDIGIALIIAVLFYLNNQARILRLLGARLRNAAAAAAATTAHTTSSDETSDSGDEMKRTKPLLSV
jgi:hypothetical protein